MNFGGWISARSTLFQSVSVPPGMPFSSRRALVNCTDQSRPLFQAEYST
jgi:hypothetical protein